MASHPMAYEEGGIYHIYNRGVAKLPVFLGPDDYHDFQDILRYLLIGFPLPDPWEVSQTSQFKRGLPEKHHLPITYKADPLGNGLFRKYIHLLAFCPMPNHFHLLLRLVDPDGRLERPKGVSRDFSPIPEFTKRLLITFAHKFNFRHNREGAVFQGRTKVKQVTSDPYVVQVARYIHLNPVVAGLTKTPDQWVYSDFNAYYSLRSLRNFSVTKPEFILNYFGGNAKNYVEFVNAGYEEEEVRGLTGMLIDAQDED